MLHEYFNKVIDENLNRLQLACCSYLKSECLRHCCEIVDKLNEILVQPIKLALGIDVYKKKKSQHRRWFGLKKLLPELLSKWEDPQNRRIGVDGLTQRVFTDVNVAVNQ